MSHQRDVKILFFALTQEVYILGKNLFKEIIFSQDTLQNIKYQVPPELEVIVCIFSHDFFSFSFYNF